VNHVAMHDINKLIGKPTNINNIPKPKSFVSSSLFSVPVLSISNSTIASPTKKFDVAKLDNKTNNVSDMCLNNLIPNDPSSATRPSGRVDCKPWHHAGFAAAHG